MAFLPAAPQFVGFVASGIGGVGTNTCSGNPQMPPVQAQCHKTIIAPLPTIAHRISFNACNYTKIILAERQGFEPWIEFPLYTLSKRAPSTTRPSLQFVNFAQTRKFRISDSRLHRPSPC